MNLMERPTYGQVWARGGQRFGLKSSHPLLSEKSVCWVLLRIFTQRVKSDISDYDQYNEQIQAVLAFEP
jgi:hypothetical protein